MKRFISVTNQDGTMKSVLFNVELIEHFFSSSKHFEELMVWVNNCELGDTYPFKNNVMFVCIEPSQENKAININNKKFAHIMFNGKNFYSRDYSFTQIEEAFYNLESLDAIKEWEEILNWAKTAKVQDKFVVTSGVFVCLGD